VKFCATESELEKKRTRKRHVLTAEKPEDISARLDTTSKKLCFSDRRGTSTSTVYAATKLFL
jgi:hypothetical protein